MDAMDIDSEQPRPPRNPRGSTVTTRLMAAKLTSHSEPRLHLLSLPREIRDVIYGYLVVVHSDRPPGHFAGPSSRPTEYIKHGIHPQILRVNRQIYGEARDLMMTRNLFVKIISNDENFLEPLDAVRDSILVRSHDEERTVLQFTSHIVQVHLKTSYAGRKKTRTTHILLLHKDLRAVLRVMYYAHVQSSSNHKVTVLISLWPSCRVVAPGVSQALCNLELADKLLQPYRQNLRQINHFQLEGPYSKDLYDAVSADMARPRHEPPREALQILKARLKMSATVSSKGWYEAAIRVLHNLAKDIIVWKEDLGLDCIRQRLIAREGSSFLSEIAELYLICMTDTAFIMIGSAKKRFQVPNNAMLTYDYLQQRSLAMQDISESASRCVARACRPLEIPELQWAPSSAQLGRLRYLDSVALGFDSRKTWESWTAIQLAMIFQPNVPEIRERFVTIRKKLLAVD